MQYPDSKSFNQAYLTPSFIMAATDHQLTHLQQVDSSFWPACSHPHTSLSHWATDPPTSEGITATKPICIVMMGETIHGWSLVLLPWGSPLEYASHLSPCKYLSPCTPCCNLYSRHFISLRAPLIWMNSRIDPNILPEWRLTHYSLGTCDHHLCGHLPLPLPPSYTRADAEVFIIWA